LARPVDSAAPAGLEKISSPGARIYESDISLIKISPEKTFFSVQDILIRLRDRFGMAPCLLRIFFAGSSGILRELPKDFRSAPKEFPKKKRKNQQSIPERSRSHDRPGAARVAGARKAKKTRKTKNLYKAYTGLSDPGLRISHICIWPD
jgi:hypothetical protein